MPHSFVAIDLGAESGRVILGTLDGGRLSLEDLHRFPNQPVRLPTGLYWDTLRLWHEILEGLRKAAQRNVPISGIGVDTWGVDVALLGPDGALIDNPRHYRDSRNKGIPEQTFQTIGRDEIFRQTGIQFMQINSLYQWHAMKLAGSAALNQARTLFFMPDLFHYLLSGQVRAEVTIASTSQFYNPAIGDWAAPLLKGLGLNASLLPKLTPAGTRLGPILPYVAEATGLDPATPVYATASHDTAAAVAAIPASEPDWCYISSGTWSLMGVELDQPVINERSLALNFTNEVGAGARIRLLKNIMGLWPLQECRRAWAQQGRDYSYEELVDGAATAKAFSAVIDPDQFLEPGHMPERIAAYCRETGQTAPESPAETCRVVLESLALRYRQVLSNLEQLTERRIPVIHIAGGGSRNKLLNQFTASCTGRTVIAGPVEATAAGNVLVQAIGAGLAAGLPEIRAVTSRSFEVTRFEPQTNAGWDTAYERFLSLL